MLDVVIPFGDHMIHSMATLAQTLVQTLAQTLAHHNCKPDSFIIQDLDYLCDHMIHSMLTLAQTLVQPPGPNPCTTQLQA